MQTGSPLTRPVCMGSPESGRSTPSSGNIRRIQWRFTVKGAADGELGGANGEWFKSGAGRGAIKGEVRG